MPGYSDHGEVLKLLSATQEADGDNRDAGREAHLFIDKRDGQWEPYWWNASQGRPRYTFDMTGPVVDQVAGQIEQADFAIRVRPAGGDATKDDAKLLDGLIRNIQNISDATDIFNIAARNMITAGIDGWQVKQKFVDDDSFDQDLVIEPIANFIDSAWLGPFKRPDASDMKWGVVLEAIERGEYEERFPEGAGQSVGDNRTAEAYFQKADQITIGQIYYIEEKPRELLRLSSGETVEADDVAPVLDELAAAGVTVTQRRRRVKNVVKSRLFDGSGWLNDAQETVFSQVPIIPTFGNFKVFENKVLYRGVVEKLIDPQRVFNYSKSREIEEGALAPRAKYWLTEKQMAGHEGTLATLNTNADPVQMINIDPENLGTPQQSGGATINPGLQSIGVDMRAIVQQTAGLFAANMGDNPGLQSGVAIEKLQRKGDTGTIKYFKAQERAICRTARILMDAIPAVYDTERQVRILKEDGSFDMKTLNQPVFDEQSGQTVTVNDLSRGKYDVTCAAGPSFQNRQQETVAAITEIAAVDPSVIQTGSDILFNNITAPGMDLIAERKRRQLFIAGQIPPDQLTDEEKQEQVAQQQQPPQPDPNMVLAQAEAGKAEAQTNKVMVDAQVAQRQEDREDFKAQQAAQKQEQQAAQQQQEFAFQQFLAVQQQQAAQQQQVIDAVMAQAEILKTIREAMGVESIVGPSNTGAYIEQAQNVEDAVSLTPAPESGI